MNNETKLKFDEILKAAQAKLDNKIAPIKAKIAPAQPAKKAATKPVAPVSIVTVDDLLSKAISGACLPIAPLTSIAPVKAQPVASIAPAKPQPVASIAPAKPQPVVVNNPYLICEINDLILEVYSDKAIVLRGNTKQHKDALGYNGLKGIFNYRLNGGAGWIFSKKRQADVIDFMNNI